MGKTCLTAALRSSRAAPGRCREQADEVIEAGEVEPLVIVGIYNTGDRRLAEYTHERDWQRGGRRGAALWPAAD